MPKGSIVTINRRIKNGNQMIDVLGLGGRIDIMVGGDGKVQTASRTWREINIGSEKMAIKPYERAFQEAQNLLQNPDAYKIADWRFGYKEEAANVAQQELPVIFEFDFVPKNREELIDFPPRQIEISAEAK